MIISEFWFCQLSLIDQCRLGPCNNSSLLVERKQPAGTHQAVSSLYACQLDTAIDGTEGLRCVVGGQFYLIGETEPWRRHARCSHRLHSLRPPHIANQAMALR